MTIPVKLLMHCKNEKQAPRRKINNRYTTSFIPIISNVSLYSLTENKESGVMQETSSVKQVLQDFCHFNFYLVKYCVSDGVMAFVYIEAKPYPRRG